ncbi:MAG: PorV/PorQ family protein [bacterium]
MSRVLLTMAAAATALVFHLLIAAGIAHGESGDRKVLSAGVGARGLALGGAYAAAANDATALVWNPAGLMRAPAKEVALYTTTLPVSDISFAYFGYAHPTLRYGTFGVGAVRFSAGGIEGRDDRNFVTDADLRDTQLRWLLGYANELSASVSYGIALKLDTHTLGGSSASSVGADLGLTIQRDGFAADALSLARAGAALRIENAVAPREKLGNQSVAEPRAIHAGLSYLLPVGGSLGGALALVEWVREEGGESRVHAGAEIEANGVAMRAGLAADAWTAGAGFALGGISADYAYEPGDLGATHKISLSHAFGDTRDELAAAAREREEHEINERLAQEIGAREGERVTALVNTGRAHLDAGRFDEARDALGGALLFKPEDAELRALHERAEREGLLASARAHIAAGDTVEALIAYQTVLEHDPANDTVRGEMETITALRAVERAAGAAARRHESAGVEALAAGRFAEAESLFAALLAEDPGNTDVARFRELARDGLEREVSLLVSQGNLLHERGLTAPAIAKWRSALALSPNDKELKKRLSDAEKEKSTRSNLAVSAEAARPAAERKALSPAETAEAAELYEKGAAVFKTGRTAEAIEYWEIVWRRDPGYGDVKGYLTKGYLIQGMEQYTAGRLAEAIETWRRALDVDPDDQKAMHYVERAGAELARTREITKK